MKLSNEVTRGARDITLASRIFLVVAVVSLVLSALLLAHNQGVFTRTMRAYFYAASAEGLNKGMAVKLIGFRVGSVQDISIEPDRRVKVELDIVEKYAPMIFNNSVVRLAREAVIGGNVLEVRPGTENTGVIEDKAVLRFERDPGIEGAVTKLLDQITPIVTDVRQFTAYLNSPEGDFRQAMRNINVTAERLGETSAGLKQLTASAAAALGRGEARAYSMLDSTEALVKDTRATLAVLDSSLRRIDTALPGITSKVEQSLENVRVTSEAVRVMTTGDLQGLMGDAGGLVTETSEVVRGARRAWPLRDVVQPPRESLLRLDGSGGLTAVPVEGARDR
jgi:phospholipid/cholesterol/gamma-HCH transport system substrate-binding protein